MTFLALPAEIYGVIDIVEPFRSAKKNHTVNIFLDHFIRHKIHGNKNFVPYVLAPNLFPPKVHDEPPNKTIATAEAMSPIPKAKAISSAHSLRS